MLVDFIHLSISKKYFLFKKLFHMKSVPQYDENEAMFYCGMLIFAGQKMKMFYQTCAFTFRIYFMLYAFFFFSFRIYFMGQVLLFFRTTRQTYNIIMLDKLFFKVLLFLKGLQFDRGTVGVFQLSHVEHIAIWLLKSNLSYYIRSQMYIQINVVTIYWAVS